MAHAGPSFDLPWPPARNPWSLVHFTGGSSSGSGAAVAAGLVPLALGSDTGGSIRGPASHCGVVGLMPTFGLVSRAGVITNSYTFDHCGPLARSVEDCALALDALAGSDPRDAGSLRRPIPSYRQALAGDLRGLRIGVLRHHWEEDIPASEDVRRAMDAALDVLGGLGAQLEECRVRPLASYFDVKIVIAESEIFSVHQKHLIARPRDFGADFRSRVLPSVLFTAHDYVQASREHRRMMVEMEPLYVRFDAFVTAGLGEAPRLSDYRSVSFWQRPSPLTAWNVTGQPVLALPSGFGRNGLPLGMQIVGRPFGETTILKVGHAYEQATEWHRRRPRLLAGARAPEVVPPPVLSGSADPVDGETRDLCVTAARRAGLSLDDLMLAQLLEGAPYALGMVRRLRRDHDPHHEPANVFSFPPV
jgi:aspartyl-tRNA(Asn)/glutamyl-tRNA(Gln) amidotransferase subunit A